MLRTIFRQRRLPKWQAWSVSSVGALHSSTSLSDLISTEKVHHTLPSTCYYEKEHFEKEKKQIMERSWLLAGHMNVLLPGKGSIAEVNISGESIVLVRNEGNEIAAYYNVCLHRGHELIAPKTRSTLRSKALRCPNHGWSFHAHTGKLVKARFSEDVVNFCGNDFYLTKVHVKQMVGLIFINLDTDSSDDNFKDLSSLFGSDLSEVLLEKIPGIDSPNMKQLAVTEKVIDANWKILSDNFLECYHCDIAHEAFVDMVDLDDYSTVIKPHHVVFESACRPDNKAYCFSKNDPLQSAFFCWLWPYNVVYSAPGSSNLSILQFIPLTPTTTLRRSERFAMVPKTTATNSSADDGSDVNTAVADSSSEEAKAAQDRVDYLNQILLQEDTSICESVQRGLQSKSYSRGRLMVSKGGSSGQKWHTELAVAYFHQLLREHTGVE
jgi:phenylpropionate dioxygenase-like ring-hydroxylating dioxygenase large terminal subunit